MHRYIEKVENNILKTIEDKILFEEEFNYIHGWLVEESYSEKIINGKKNEMNYPFILIRPEKFEQKNRNGITERTQTFLIRIGIKEREATGYQKIIKIRDKIISYFTENNYAVGENSYNLSLEMNSYFNEEMTVGDYWGVDIIINAVIPVINEHIFTKSIEL